jgi:peptidoglycan/LPS O-acetylase OafA/YrhL
LDGGGSAGSSDKAGALTLPVGSGTHRHVVSHLLPIGAPDRPNGRLRFWEMAHRLDEMSALTHDDYRAQKRFDVLDGVRAVCILLVVTSHPKYPHVWPAIHGKTGVTIFFLLSGYLITTLALREEDRRGRLDVVAFYVRRTFRIAPLYLTILALYAVLLLGLHQEPDRRAAFVRNVPEYLLFLPEHAVFFPHNGEKVPFDGSWSLGIEEKFYLLWPLLGFVILAHRLRGRLVTLGIITAGLFVLPFTLHGAWGLTLEPYFHIALGCILALLMHERRSFDVIRRLGEPVPLAVLLGGLLVLQFSTDEINNGGWLYSVYGLVAVLGLAGVIVTRTAVTTALTRAPMLLIGRLSYALYLTHSFGLNFAESYFPATHFGGFGRSVITTILGLGIGLAMAYALHIFVEQPMIKLGRRVTHRLAPAPGQVLADAP